VDANEINIKVNPDAITRLLILMTRLVLCHRATVEARVECPIFGLKIPARVDFLRKVSGSPDRQLDIRGVKLTMSSV
jgi:hypothetical protein